MTGTTATGERFDLDELRGQKIWLAFFRYASCPLCNLRVSEISARHTSLQAAGLTVVGVVQSPPERVAEFMGTQKPPFTMVCDPSEALYGRFGLETSLRGYAHPKNIAVMAQAAKAGFVPSPKMDGSKTRLPADFLIDQNHMLADVFYADIISAHIPFERVEHFVR